MCLRTKIRFNPRCYQEADPQRDEKLSPLFERVRPFARFDHVARVILNADDSIK